MNDKEEKILPILHIAAISNTDKSALDVDDVMKSLTLYTDIYKYIYI
jgi:hypothetical protein